MARKLESVATILMMSVAVVLLAAAGSSYFRPRRQSVTVEPPVPSEAVSLEGAVIAGCRSAPIAVIEYSDFQCPACGAFARDVLPLIRHRYIDTCKVLLAFRSFPVAAMHRFAVQAAEAAACAAREGRFWPMHDLLYQEQDRLDHSGLVDKARRLGLDEARFRVCLEAHLELSQVRRNAGEGVTLGISSTPTLFFGLVQEDKEVKIVQRVGGVRPASELQRILDELLRQAEDSGTRH
jgi:protein-disulfide isomerase